MKKHKNTTDSKKVKVLEEYPSAHIILESVKKEYDIEEERTKTLDSRVSIFISLATALLALVSQSINLKKIPIKEIDTLYEILIYGSYILLSIFIPILTVISIIFFVRIVTAKEYSRNNLDDFESIKLNKLNPDIAAYALTKRYVENIRINTNVNDKKHKSYKYGIYFLTLSIVASGILYILSINI